MRTLAVNGTHLCVDETGSDTDPPILLIGGASSSLDWWDDALCARLAAGGRRVIRYDHRDTGESAHAPAGAPGYRFDDLAADVPALLDALGIGRAHIAGLSMGGGIAQRIAIEQPARVATLTLLSTSSDGPGSDDLPPPAPELAARFGDPPPAPDWSDRDAVIEHMVEEQRAFAGTPFDEVRVRAIAGRVVDRTADIEAASTNHWLLDGSGEPLRPRLGQITAPTLVVHGTDDPLFPPAHGEALAREIPGARLLILPGVGHEVPPPRVWDIFVPALLEHTARPL
jgi:pimeloyl-ACP methyl ester carboxylesterase